MGSLVSGILKHSVSSGVSTPAVATEGVDYCKPAGGDLPIATPVTLDLTDSGNATLYTVPAGKSFLPVRFMVLNPSADLSATTADGVLARASDGQQMSMGSGLGAWFVLLSSTDAATCGNLDGSTTPFNAAFIIGAGDSLQYQPSVTVHFDQTCDIAIWGYLF